MFAFMEDEKVAAVSDKMVVRRRAIIKGAECPEWARARFLAAPNFGDQSVSLIVCEKGALPEINSLLVGLYACLRPCECAKDATQFTVSVQLNASAAIPLAPCYHAKHAATQLLKVLDIRGVRFFGDRASQAVFSVPVQDRSPIEVAMGIGAFRRAFEEFAGDKGSFTIGDLVNLGDDDLA